MTGLIKVSPMVVMLFILSIILVISVSGFSTIPLLASSSSSSASSSCQPKRRSHFGASTATTTTTTITTTTKSAVRVNQEKQEDEEYAIDDDSSDDLENFSSFLEDVNLPPEDCTDAVLYSDNDDDDDDISCLPPGRRSLPGSTSTKTIFAVSDSTGITAKSAIQKSIVQFGSCDDERYSSEDCDVQIRTFTFVKSNESMAKIVKVAAEKNAAIVFTISDAKLRDETIQMCDLSGVTSPVIDLLGPTLRGLSTFLDKDPIGDVVRGTTSTSSLSSSSLRKKGRVGLSDSYYQRIAAVEFTLKADDGQAPWLLEEADVIIVGVSRTGKTPLSVVLSQTMGLKVANIPLVLEVPPPKELLDMQKIDPDRIFCLTIAPSELKRIRTTRLERRNVKTIEEQNNNNNAATKNRERVIMNNNNAQRSGVNGDIRGQHRSSSTVISNYNDRAYVMNDLRNARDLSAKYGWTQIDVTGRAVEETASLVSELLNERFYDDEDTTNRIIGSI